jgi:hypothetical protein
MRTFARLIGALALAASLAACHGVVSPSSYPDDNFTGTIAPGGQADKAFNVGSTGEMQMTLVSLSPQPQVGFLAIGVGQYVGGICSPIGGYYASQAPIGQQLSFSTIQQGAYCMLIADANLALKTSATFTINTKHP